MLILSNSEGGYVMKSVGSYWGFFKSKTNCLIYSVAEY